MDQTLEDISSMINSIVVPDGTILAIIKATPSLARDIGKIYEKKLDNTSDPKRIESLTGTMQGFGTISPDFASTVADSIGRSWLRMVKDGGELYYSLHTLQAYSASKLGSRNRKATSDDAHAYVDTILEGIAINPEVLSEPYLIFGLKKCLDTRGQKVINAFQTAANGTLEPRLMERLQVFQTTVQRTLELQVQGEIDIQASLFSYNSQ